MANIVDLITKLVKLIHVMLFRDLVCAILFFTFQFKLFWVQRKNKVLINYFDETVRRHPDKVALKFHGENHTFQDLANFSNKVSNWIETTLQLGHDDEWEQWYWRVHPIPDKKPPNREAKIRKKFEDNTKPTQIGLMFGNIPELAGFIIGISRVRCASVLFNTNHRLDTLINSFRATDCKVFIFESKYLSAIKDIAKELPDIRFFMYDRQESKKMIVEPHYKGLSRSDLLFGRSFDKANQFASILNAYPVTKVTKNYPYQFGDMIHYLFTSGTTGGNIKAVPVDNVRYVGGAISQTLSFGLRNSDNMYICLPCYHGFAGVLGFGTMIVNGSTVTLTEKFSASKFWKDCRENECTIAFYIGEICRYLLAQPKRPDDDKHSLRMLFGIGLSKENWILVRDRFKIPRISEYYASTEGNILIVNYMNVPGSCGFLPYYYGPLLYTLWPCHLIKVDPKTLEFDRDPKTGLCRMAKNGDIGMMVGEIKSGQIFTEYLGYACPEESAKKLVRDVRTRGDFVFASGDLMEMDFFGNLYFRDRTGDTFRWKGENVSTTEIEMIVTQFLNHQDCIVYGVLIPHCEGRAGMMAITDKQVDLEKMYEYMKARIPEYAIPKFIRITDQIPTTSTHKYIKYPLREAGFDLDQLKPDERLYYFEPTVSKYLPLDINVYQKIQSGSIKF